MPNRSLLQSLLFTVGIGLIWALSSAAAPEPFDIMFPWNNDTVSTSQPCLMWGDAGPVDTFVNETMAARPAGVFKGDAVYDPLFAYGFGLTYP